MINGFLIYDADAHVNVAPQMWEDLPKEFAARRPRPALIHDNDELGYFSAGWLTDGRMEPHALGPGLQPATPAALGRRRAPTAKDGKTPRQNCSRARMFRKTRNTICCSTTRCVCSVRFEPCDCMTEVLF